MRQRRVAIVDLLLEAGAGRDLKDPDPAAASILAHDRGYADVTGCWWKQLPNMD